MVQLCPWRNNQFKKLKIEWKDGNTICRHWADTVLFSSPMQCTTVSVSTVQA